MNIIEVGGSVVASKQPVVQSCDFQLETSYQV